jgi:hypothetical protein
MPPVMVYFDLQLYTPDMVESTSEVWGNHLTLYDQLI